MIDTFGFDARLRAVDDLHAKTSFYTCSPIVEGLLDRVDWPRRKGRLVDPSAGDGAFVVAALRRLRLPPGDMVGADRVRGCEIHPSAVAAARENVECELVSAGWSLSLAAKASRRIIVEADFLTDFAGEGFSIIAANPPYLAYRRWPELFKSSYGEVLVDYARADLLHAFLDKCCAMLPPDGRIGCVVADRWLTNDNAARLREVLGAKIEVVYANRLDESSSFYRPKSVRVRGAPPRIHPVEMVMAPRGAGYRPLSRDAFYLEGESGHRSDRCLGDVADVRMAPWVGPTGIFLLPSESTGAAIGLESIPAIAPWNIPADRDALTGDLPSLIMRRSEDSADEALRKHIAAATKRHLDTLDQPDRKRALSSKWYERSKRALPAESVRLPLDVPGLVVPRIARRIRPIRFSAGTVPVNHMIVLYQRTGGPTLDEIEGMLRSPTAAEWLKTAAKRIENGYYLLETQVLRRMPI